jgi:hypothetical protein
VKRPLGRHRLRLCDNIKMDLTDIRWACTDRTNVAHDRVWRRALLNIVRNCRVVRKEEIYWLAQLQSAANERLFRRGKNILSETWHGHCMNTLRMYCICIQTHHCGTVKMTGGKGETFEIKREQVSWNRNYFLTFR